MDKRRVIIAGGREFNNYELLKWTCDLILFDFKDDVEVISGMAIGADTLGVRYAREKGYKVIEKPANWNLYGKGAGPRRNKEMAQIGDILIAFWNGQIKNSGTANMILQAHRQGLEIEVVRYSKNQKAIEGKV